MSQQTYRVILTDDESLARERLKRLLAAYNWIEIIDEARNGEEAAEKINQQKPDLVFLDIQMPLANGFEMLKKLTHLPLIIFVTAYEEYAIKAFEENSIDYLLKPVEAERLEKALQKLQRLGTVKESVSEEQTQLLQLLTQLKPKKEITTIPVQVGERISLIALSEIAYFEADGKYVYLINKDSKKHLVDFTLTVLEEKLPDYFLRVHKSFIVNQNAILHFEKYFRGCFILHMNDKQNSKITTGRSYSEEVKDLLKI